MQKTAEFDPYYKWLGIRPEHQPPNHYRLLGLETFEADGEIVRAAAERQTAYLQTYKIGPQSEFSQRLLNEVARAKVCLLDSARKAEYDRGLRALMAPVQPPVVPIPAPPRAATAIAPMPVASIAPGNSNKVGPSISPAAPSRRLQPRNRVSWAPAIIISAIGCVVAALAIVLLAPTKHPVTKPQSAVPTPVPNLQPKEESPRKKRHASSSVSPNQSGKHPVPSIEQQQKGRKSISIDGHLPPSDLLKAAIESKQPWQSYVLYQMAIDAALAENEPEVAKRAIASLLERFEVDDTAVRELRARIFAVESKAFLPKVAEPEAAPARSAPAIDLVKQLTLPSKGTVSLFPPNPLEAGAAKSIFSQAPAKTGGWFILNDRDMPVGAFFCTQEGQERFFDGPALVLYPNGRPLALLDYRNHRRHGDQFHWDPNGALVVHANYENGRPRGLIVQYKDGRATAVEEWSSSRTPTRYRITTLPDRVFAEEVPDGSVAISDPIESQEGEWKRSFSSWWRDHDRKLKQLERALQISSGKDKTINQSAVESYRKRLLNESHAGRDKLLERLNIAQPSGNLIP